MDRLACVDLPALPLQILHSRRPEPADAPCAVVSRRSPQGEILFADENALGAGVRVGQRYGAALALCPTLWADEVSTADVARTVAEIADVLEKLSPEVEPANSAPGTFWVSAAGMARLHRSASAFARAVRNAVAAAGFEAGVAVGFDRFRTLALARERGGAFALRTPEEERTLAVEAKLSRFDIPKSARDALASLGVSTVGHLLALPPTGLLERFGPELHELSRMARGESWRPLSPRPDLERFSSSVSFDFADADAERLCFRAKALLHPLLARLASRQEAVAEIILRIDLDRRAPAVSRIRPAAPTLDAVRLAELIALRLSATELASGAVGLAVEARAVPADPEQLRLFAQRDARDLEALNRAIARLCAQLGEEAVVRARLSEGHLPEARFFWEKLETFPAAAKKRPTKDRDETIARPQPQMALVRRIREKPLPLGTRPVGGPQGIHLGGLDDEPVIRADGPYIVSGGWWRKEVHREYFFAETKSGRVLWVYFDRRRRRWFLQGELA